MKKITLILLVLFTITSCEKETTQPAAQQQQTNLLNPPSDLIGKYYRNTILYLEITENDVIFKEESFTEKYKNFNLKESITSTKYYIETSMKASVALDDRERFEIYKENDYLIYKELKMNGVTYKLDKK